MHVVLWIVGVLVTLFILLYLFVLADFLISRKGFEPSRATFALETLSSGDGPSILVVYLPGILARSEDQMCILRDAFKSGVRGRAADLLRVDYAGERFDAETIADEVWDRVDSMEPDYGQIVFVGASLGGRLLNNVWSRIDELDMLALKVTRPIVVDAPMDHRDFAKGGTALAMLLRWVPIGRMVNSLRLTDKMAALPADKNIGNMADFSLITGGWAQTYPEYIEWVKTRSRAGLTGHVFSVWRDQLVAMSQMTWYGGVFGNKAPLYLACSDEEMIAPWGFTEEIRSDVTDTHGLLPAAKPTNDTIKQPRARLQWLDRVPGLRYWIVASTHCGFLERPVAWQLALTTAVRRAL